jgi:tetratricopeptide (TPR) repeat protein
MALQDIVVMIHNGEYGRAISTLEQEASNKGRPPLERVEYYKWLAECHERLGDYQESANCLLEAVRVILAAPMGGRAKSEQSVPLCDKALECFKQEGDSADVLMAARLRQYLIGLSRK